MQSKLEAIFRTAFHSAIPASLNNTAFENQGFDSAGKTKWFGFHYLPNRPEVATLGNQGQDEFTGIIQIDINILIGSGKGGIEEDVDALRNTFKAGARFIDAPVNVIITSCGRSGPGFRVEGFHRFVVSIAWESRISRNQS